MELSSTSPARLYALLLKLRPLEHGTLMAFSGELVHGALMHWIGDAAPDVATMLHEDNKRRFFTCSSLQFPLPPARMQQAERENTHLPLDPDTLYTIRITLLLGELYPLFHHTLIAEDTEAQSRLRIGKQVFTIEEVITDPDASRQVDFTSFSHLLEKAQSLRLRKAESLKLEFASLTAFNRGNAKQRAYGNFIARLPLPSYIFPGLARRWQELAPPELHHLIQREAIEQYIQDDGIIITDYDLKPHHVYFTTHQQPGFTGTCTYQLRGPDDPTTPDAPLTVRQQLLLLAQLAFYCGVGYKSAMGLGQIRLL